MMKDIKTSSEIKNMTLNAKQDSKEKVRPRQEKKKKEKKLESLAEFILAII